MSDATSVPYVPAGHPAVSLVNPTKDELKPNAIGLVKSTVIR